MTVSLAHILSLSEYGNYIIQHVLKNGPQSEQEALGALIRNNIYALSLNKYGRYLSFKSCSNTVEKYIEQSGREELKEIRALLMKCMPQEYYYYLST